MRFRNNPLLSLPGRISSSSTSVNQLEFSEDCAGTSPELSLAFLLAAFAFAMVSRKAADDLGELVAQTSLLLAVACSWTVAETFLPFFGPPEGGVDGAIVFSPLDLGFKRVGPASMIELPGFPPCLDAGAGSLNMDDKGGFPPEEEEVAILPPYVDLTLMVCAVGLDGGKAPLSWG